MGFRVGQDVFAVDGCDLRDEFEVNPKLRLRVVTKILKEGEEKLICPTIEEVMAARAEGRKPLGLCFRREALRPATAREVSGYKPIC